MRSSAACAAASLGGFGVPTRLIRFLAAICVLFGGLGLVIYTALWICILRRDETESIASRIVSRKRETQLLLVCGTGVIALLIAADAVGLAQGSNGLSWVLGRFSWAVSLSCVGLFGVWRGASLDEKLHLQELLNSAPIIGADKLRGWKQTVARAAAGVALVVVGFATVSKGGVGALWSRAHAPWRSRPHVRILRALRTVVVADGS